MPQLLPDCFSAMPSPVPGRASGPKIHGRERPLIYTSPDVGGAASGAPKSPALLRVLVVEDSLDVAESLEKILRGWGHAARICTSGNEALALAPYYDPQVVLIDIGLPDMDGWELTGRLRAQKPEGSPIFIAITAHGEQHDFRRSEAAGISYHLVKPSFQPQLRQILDRLARED